MSLATVAVAITFIFLIKSFVKWIFESYKGSSIPCAKPWIPFFGNKPFLDFQRLHIQLTELSELYGGVFEIYIGREHAVVLNDYASIHCGLVSCGDSVAGRPEMFQTVQKRRHKTSIVCQTITPELLFLRKQVHKSLQRYTKDSENLRILLERECARLFDVFDSFAGKPFDPRKPLFFSITGIMFQILAGKEMKESMKAKVLKMSELFNDIFGLSEHALSLRDRLWMDVHMVTKENPCENSVLFGLYEHINSNENKEMDITEDTIKEVFTNLVLAGTDTTATALNCFLLLLVNHPTLQEDLHREVCDNLHSIKKSLLQDRHYFSLVNATILELLRYISHVPLALPHSTIRDTIIQGKHVPANTTVYINLWAMHHDSKIWEDPWTFNPYRFLDENGEILPRQHKVRRRLMPFGAGRRVCLGESLGKNRLFYYVCNIIKEFRFEAEDPSNPPNADPRSYTTGLVLHPQKYKIKAFRRANLT